jgi:ABC-2 type transport system ATP-binding protein
VANAQQPVISVHDVAVEFSRGRRHRSIKDWAVRRAPDQPSRQFWALDGVSFDVHRGEAIGVVGRNGQGKSTLLKVIAGVLLPDRGNVVVREGVAPLIEITGGFVNDLTVRENVFLTAGLHGMSKATITARFDEIVEFAEIPEFLDTPYKHLSSGMKVRIAFAVISRLEEPIILVDEVLAVGDKAFREKCYNRIEELIGDGRTLFLVSHSEQDLRRFCTRGLYLERGKIRVDGTLDEALDSYAQDTAA